MDLALLMSACAGLASMASGFPRPLIQKGRGAGAEPVRRHFVSWKTKTVQSEIHRVLARPPLIFISCWVGTVLSLSQNVKSLRPWLAKMRLTVEWQICLFSDVSRPAAGEATAGLNHVHVEMSS